MQVLLPRSTRRDEANKLSTATMDACSEVEAKMTTKKNVVTPPRSSRSRKATVGSMAAGVKTRTEEATEDLGTKHAEFIVVFKERSASNTSVMSSVLSVGGGSGTSARSSRTMLAANHEWAVQPRVYERMGVAVADLDPDERERLERHDAVEAVVVNEIRRLPTPIAHDESTDDVPPSTPSDAVPLFVESANLSALLDRPTPSDPRIAYVQGMRDGLDVVLRRLSESADARGEALPNGAPVFGSATHSWALRMLGLSESYSRFTGVGARIAVLDTGIDLDHPDFAGRLDSADLRSFIKGESVMDRNGHGTHCAGVIAGAANPAGGRRYSVAPDAELIIGKVLNDKGEGYDDGIIDGIDWAVDAGAQVISMSLGASRARNAPYSVAYETVARNYLTGDPGVLIVAAAGNDSMRPQSIAAVNNPAACPSILAVAAVDSRGRVASFSCGSVDSIGRVDLSGPGVGVHSAWTGGRYSSISGTSMATPHVAGVCALLIQSAPDTTARQLWNRLQTTGRPLGRRADFGFGLVLAP